jgi:hypothetical protein
MRRTNPSDEFGWFLGALPAVVALGAIAYVLLSSDRDPALPNATVFGCYVAPNSPAILLNASGMHVRQEGYPTIPFHLERHKTGIALTADKPIRADNTGNGYRFGVDRRGSGWFMDFYRVQDGRTYGVFDERDLEGFQMLASDGEYLNYDPADAARCAK